MTPNLIAAKPTMSQTTTLSQESDSIAITFQKSGTRETARYVSSTSVCEEALHDTRWIGLYWSASGQVQRENVTVGLPGRSPLEFALHAFELEIDGQDLRDQWEFVASSERAGEYPGTRESIVELRHLLRPVSIRIVTRLDGTPFLVRYLEITNSGETVAALGRVSPWSGSLWNWNGKTHHGEIPIHVSKPFALGFFDSLAQGSEGNFRWEDLHAGTRRIESTNGHSGFGNPFVMLRNQITGESAVLSLAWSGNWFAEFWHDPYRDLSNAPGRGINLGFRMGPSGPAPLRVLEPGETIRTPETHLGIMHADDDAVVAAWHEHLRVSVIPPRPAGKEMFSTAGRVVEHPGEWILHEVDIAAEMGSQAFIVDAGWYGDEFGGWWERRGDWWVGSWMPGGLKDIRERCHQNGMLFGLWMEPEVIGQKSRLLQEHPEWVLRNDSGPEVEKALNLANPEAAAFFRNEVLRVVREHQPDFFKIDYNIRVHEGGQYRRHGFLENEAWRHYETLYATFDQVRRELPEVALECCASGGGRNDLGMMSRFHYACESDFSSFPRSIRAINGLTYFLPPESLCYYHNHMSESHLKTDLDTHLRVTLFAQPIFVGFGAQDADRSSAYFRTTRRYIQLAKEFTAPILASKPVVYHHTPGIGLYEPAPWCVLEYTAADRSRGYAGVFQLESQAGDYCLRLRGVDGTAHYRVTLDNRQETLRLSGYELRHHGVLIPAGAAMTSELVLFEREIS